MSLFGNSHLGETSQNPPPIAGERVRNAKGVRVLGAAKPSVGRDIARVLPIYGWRCGATVIALIVGNVAGDVDNAAVLRGAFLFRLT